MDSKMYEILCFGDSNTYGWDPATGGRFNKRGRWPMILQSHLGKGYHVIEEGLTGRTMVTDDPSMPGRCGKQYLAPCLHSHKPLDLVIIMLGTNDLKTAFKPSVEKLRDGMEELINVVLDVNRLYAATPAEILLVSPIHVSDAIKNSFFFDEFGIEAIGLSKQFADIFHGLAKQYGCLYFDASQHAVPSSTDGVHLDTEGHAALAKALAVFIAAL